MYVRVRACARFCVAERFDDFVFILRTLPRTRFAQTHFDLSIQMGTTVSCPLQNDSL